MSRTNALSASELAASVDLLLRTRQVDHVTKLVNQVTISRESLEPYLIFSAGHHTCNLIFRNERFQMPALCWEPGQRTWIHNHGGQDGWMIVTEGELAVRNYTRRGCNPQNRTVRLQPTLEFVIRKGAAGNVDQAEPIYLVWNPSRHQEAVSIHIYSRPLDSCVVFDTESGRCRENQLSYTSQYGTPLLENATGPIPGAICGPCPLSRREQAVHCGLTRR